MSFPRIPPSPSLPTAPPEGFYISSRARRGGHPGRPPRRYWTAKPPPLPRFGRFRLFEYAGPARQRLRCRLCNHTVRRDNQWVHHDLHARTLGASRAAELLQGKARWRGKERYRREAQRYYMAAREDGVDVAPGSRRSREEREETERRRSHV